MSALHMTSLFNNELEKAKVAALCIKIKQLESDQDLVESVSQCDIHDIVAHIRTTGETGLLKDINTIYVHYASMINLFNKRVSQCGESFIRKLLTQSAVLEYIEHGDRNWFESHQQFIQYLFSSDKSHRTSDEAFRLVCARKDLLYGTENILLQCKSCKSEQ